MVILVLFTSVPLLIKNELVSKDVLKFVNFGIVFLSRQKAFVIMELIKEYENTQMLFPFVYDCFLSIHD